MTVEGCLQWSRPYGAGFCAYEGELSRADPGMNFRQLTPFRSGRSEDRLTLPGGLFLRSSCRFGLASHRLVLVLSAPEPGGFRNPSATMAAMNPVVRRGRRRSRAEGGGIDTGLDDPHAMGGQAKVVNDFLLGCRRRGEYSFPSAKGRGDTALNEPAQ